MAAQSHITLQSFYRHGGSLLSLISFEKCLRKAGRGDGANSSSVKSKMSVLRGGHIGFDHPRPFIRLPYFFVRPSGLTATVFRGVWKYPHKSVLLICGSPNSQCSNWNAGTPKNCRMNPTGFSKAQNLSVPVARHCQIIRRQAAMTGTAVAKSRGLLPFAMENSVHGGAASMP